MSTMWRETKRLENGWLLQPDNEVTAPQNHMAWTFNMKTKGVLQLCFF